MTEAESDKKAASRQSRMMDTPEYKATFNEILSIRGRSRRLIDRQVSDLRAMLTRSEQRELLDDLDLSIAMHGCAIECLHDCMVNPFLINDADFKEDLLSMRMLLSQHGEKDEGIQPTED